MKYWKIKLKAQSPTLKNKLKEKKGGALAQVVEHLLSKYRL
jgi:hypothetical protein